MEQAKKTRIKLTWHKYKQLRTKVWKRDNYTCQDSNCPGGWSLDKSPHHIIFKSHGGDDSEKNLITLCIYCHAKKHGITVCQQRVTSNGSKNVIR